MPTSYLDRYGRGRSPCHRLPPTWKLALTLGAILAAVLIPPESWPAHGILLTVIFIGHTLAGIPLRYLARRLLWFLPAAGALAISCPLAHSFAAGGDLAAAVLLRSTVAFCAALWLVNVTPFDQLLATLQDLRVPPVLPAMLAFMYRYVFVLWDELDRMRTARRARSFGEGSTLQRWNTSGQMVGMLTLRAMDRAHRVHGAMCARGWDGRIRTLDD